MALLQRVQAVEPNPPLSAREAELESLARQLDALSKEWLVRSGADAFVAYRNGRWCVAEAAGIRGYTDSLAEAKDIVRRAATDSR